MISKTANKIIFVSHEFISSISEVSIHQNKILHKELRDIFNIQYHKSTRIDGKKYRDGFAIEFTENTEIILKNPKLFYSSQTSENSRLSEKKFSVKREKILAPICIDLEHPLEELKEEEPKGYSSSFNSKKEPHQKNITLASSSFGELAKVYPKQKKAKMQNNNLDPIILQKFGALKGQDIIKNCSIKKLPNGSVQVQSASGENLDDGDKHLLRTCIKEVYGEDISIVAAKEKFSNPSENHLWEQFKEVTQNHFRSKEDANIVISTWFAKLKCSQNIGSNKLIFIGSVFMIGWVDNHYSSLIEEVCKQKKMNIELIYEDNYAKPILYQSGIGKFQRMSEEKINELISKPLATYYIPLSNEPPYGAVIDSTTKAIIGEKE